MAPTLSVTFLGTASAYPMPKKAASSVMYQYGDFLWMFDCGEGTQTQLMKSDLKAGKVAKVFITHMHGDHLYGLPGLMCTISQNNQRKDPVEIYGPLGIAKYLRVTLGLSQSDIGFNFRIIELVPTQEMYQDMNEKFLDVELDNELRLHPCELPSKRIEPQYKDGIPTWSLIEDGPVGVKAGALAHRVPSFAFILQEQNLKGSFNKAKLNAFGLQPGKICGRLQCGETVETPDGRSVTLNDVTDPPKTGRKVVICGDSRDSTKIALLAQNADVYIHEATVQDSMKEKALERGHSTPSMAAEFAKLASAKLLYLTHFSQRYTPSSKEVPDFTINDLQSEAQSVFGSNVLIAEDLYTYDVKVPK